MLSKSFLTVAIAAIATGELSGADLAFPQQFSDLHIPSTSLTVGDALKNIAALGNYNLVQDVTYFSVDNQKARTERLEINPLSNEFIFRGQSSNGSETMYGCARIDRHDLIYSAARKKWLVVQPGGNQFIVQNNLDEIFFSYAPIVRNQFAAAKSEWVAGRSSSDATLIADALDKLQSLHLVSKDNIMPWQYRGGDVVIDMKIEKGSFIRAINITKDDQQVSSLTNELVPVSNLAMPPQEIVDLSGSDLANVQPLTEADIREKVLSLSGKKPVFGFAYVHSAAGLVVQAVGVNTPADRAGLKNGMKLTMVNGASISTMDAGALMELLAKQDKISLVAEDSGGTHTYELQKQ